MFLTRNEYYYNYYKNKKHEYRERYERMKRWEQEKEEIFKDYGGERKYYLESYKELCRNNNVNINKDDISQTPIQREISSTQKPIKHKSRNKQINKNTSINT